MTADEDVLADLQSLGGKLMDDMLDDRVAATDPPTLEISGEPSEPATKVAAVSDSTRPTTSVAVRETVEFAVMLVIVWLMLRGFQVEPFVIPTGSMAPTLQGRHHEIACEQCGYWFRVGASSESSDHNGELDAGRCPICRYQTEFQVDINADHQAFVGDRILVSKLAYDLGEPRRWDVVVFKYPSNPKVNFIKRLVGLPNETIRIWHGDIYVQSQVKEKDTRTPFRIARKPPSKLVSMLQVVDDTDHIPQKLIDVGWPSRWQTWAAGGGHSDDWKIDLPNRRYTVEPTLDDAVWLRYRHLVPRPHLTTGEHDWDAILRGELPLDLRTNINARGGQLISDYYPYNDWMKDQRDGGNEMLGLHWVGDLALECEVAAESDTGELLLDLVEGGTHYQCRIDVATGEAELSIDGADRANWGNDATLRLNPSAKTDVRGSGSYQLRFANIDDELTLWIDDEPVTFDRPTTYVPLGPVTPQWTEDDPLDLAPAGVGSRGARLVVTRLSVLRDIYYVARSVQANFDHDYETIGFPGPGGARDVFQDKSQWRNNAMFKGRRSVEFELGEDQFFPLGDNSPQSRDARMWGDEPYFHRSLLTGKAIAVYWPHTWNRPIPFWPNFRRMKLIR